MEIDSLFMILPERFAALNTAVVLTALFVVGIAYMARIFKETLNSSWAELFAFKKLFRALPNEKTRRSLKQ